jgi:hypothetical protein
LDAVGIEIRAEKREHGGILLIFMAVYDILRIQKVINEFRKIKKKIEKKLQFLNLRDIFWGVKKFVWEKRRQTQTNDVRYQEGEPPHISP